MSLDYKIVEICMVFEDGFKEGSKATACVNPYHEIQTSLHTAWSYGYMKGREYRLAQAKCYKV